MIHSLGSPVLFLPFWFSSHRLSLLHPRCSELGPTRGRAPTMPILPLCLRPPALLSECACILSAPVFLSGLSSSRVSLTARSSELPRRELPRQRGSEAQTLCKIQQRLRSHPLLHGPWLLSLRIWHRAWELALPALSRMESPSGCGCLLQFSKTGLYISGELYLKAHQLTIRIVINEQHLKSLKSNHCVEPIRGKGVYQSILMSQCGERKVTALSCLPAAFLNAENSLLITNCGKIFLLLVEQQLK